MAAADVRDMLDLPAEGQPRPHKKQKVVEKRPGVSFTIAKNFNSRLIQGSLYRGYHP